MKKKILENILILIGSLGFYLLFWQEKMGINIIIYDLMMISALFAIKPNIRKYRPVLITTLGTLLTAILIVWNNSLVSKIIHLISFTSLVGFAKQKDLRFLFYGFMLSLISFGEIPVNLAKQFSKRPKKQTWRLAPVLRSFRLSLVPLFVLIVFYSIYHLSNVEFRNFSNQFWGNFIDWFSWNISIPQILFFITGFLITANILLKSDFPIFKNLQKRHRENLLRLRGKHPLISKGMIALKSEFQSGLILLFALNALLLIVNILDIRSLYTGSEYQMSPIELSSMVHDTTNLLILALVLAMLVISFYFRKNLNFYPKNKLLKWAGYFWMVQNGILAISLFLKNYQYIEANGLAYRRIGVLVFLLLVFAGLLTMIIKIRDRKSFYFLVQRNAWIAYGVFIVCSFVNWDVFITRYNLSTPDKSRIDYSFLINDVSDKNIYLLLEQQKQNLLLDNRRQAISYALANKKETFLRKQKSKTWRSWNLADYKNRKYLNYEE